MPGVDDEPTCAAPPGALRPRIDRNRCTGRSDCVAVCPYGVFALGLLPPDQRGGLSLPGRLKGFAHGWKQSFAVRAEACRGCGLCVDNCPERAIRLERA